MQVASKQAIIRKECNYFFLRLATAVQLLLRSEKNCGCRLAREQEEPGV